MKRTMLGCVLGSLWIAIGFHGCVNPGELDPSVIARYQRKMAGRAPLKRMGGRTELGLLDPAPREGPAPLKVEETKDESGTVRRVVRLSLKDTIVRALAGAPAIQVVSFDPAISREQMVQAAAAFDVILSGETSYNKRDNKRYATALAPREDERAVLAKLNQLLPTGTEWGLAWGANRDWDSRGVANSATKFEPTMVFQVRQPLLREGWLDYNLGKLRLARLDHKSKMQAFRLEVEGVITNVYRLYWQLHQAREEFEIQKRLVEWHEKTRKMIQGRGEMDAHIVTRKQAESAEEFEKGSLVLREKSIYDLQEQLGVLLGDSQINALGKLQIIPTTPFAEGPVVINVADQLGAALKHNPTLVQGRLAIQATGVQIKIDENELLPKLDLTASAGLQGMAGSRHVAGRELMSGDYVNYTIGLAFEYPIGNRERSSELRASKLNRSKAIASFQQNADQIAASVRERVRQIDTAFRAWEVHKRAVEAYKILVEGHKDRTPIEGMNPLYLNLKLRDRERMAQAERAKLQALVDYNSALIELRLVTGTVLDLPGLKISLP